ncbi:replication protein A 70 kDa DNA-binding subunit A-like isoform [Arachis hypogaea]|nr:replication protein A 70 kDa DNA-binding subunit A-like isoform [Arachis hypogaea]
MSSQDAFSDIDELTVESAIIKSIDEVLTSTVWIVGTIVSINAGKEDWFYKSCRKCLKKTETPIGNRYEYTKCDHTHGCAALRYKVEIMVHDGTGSINLLLWDRKTYQLYGKQAEKVKEEEICDDHKIIEKNIPVIDTTNLANNVEDGLEEYISNLKYKTPAKRACSEMKPASNGLNHIEEEGQLSTNKFYRKGFKKQKSLMNEVDN